MSSAVIQRTFGRSSAEITIADAKAMASRVNIFDVFMSEYRLSC